MAAKDDETKVEKKGEQKKPAAKNEQKQGSTRFFFPGDANRPSKIIWADSQDEALAKYNESLGDNSNG